VQYGTTGVNVAQRTLQYDARSRLTSLMNAMDDFKIVFSGRR